MKVLVADDEPLVLKILVRLLEFLEHEALSAENGSNALRLLREHDDIDLAILDQNMPDLTGTDVLSELREFRPELPVLISTGERSLELEDPRSSLLEKPYRLETLEQALANVQASRF